MNKSISTLIKVIIFGIITAAGIIYVFNQSPVENISTYEKQEMVKPNRSNSMIDTFFASEPETDSEKRRNAAENDDVSLTGSGGRYNEVRIGRSAE